MSWLTVPQWPEAPIYPVFHREQEPMMPKTRTVPENVHVLVRAVFDLPAGGCRLHLSADDYYYAWLDGSFLGGGPAPGYPSHYRYDSYPLTGGRRVVLGLHIYYQGLINRVWNSGDGRFGFFLRLESDHGEIAPTGLRCTRCDAYQGDVIGYDTQFLENFDSRRYPEGWKESNYDDAKWDIPLPAKWADYQMYPREIKPLQWSLATPVTASGKVLDFGREITGIFTAKAVGHAGQKVLLRFGEELDEAGDVRFSMRCNCRYEECWTLAEGESTLHQFDYKAFRYVSVLPEPGVTLGEIGVYQRHYPMQEDACTLRCPAAELEDIFRICKTAVRCGCQEGYLDCPSREKGQYLGDAVITARSQVWLTGTTELLRKCISDFMCSLAVSPGMMAVAPGALMQEIADYSLLFPLLPLTDYEFTGDAEFLRQCYPAVVSVTEAFAAYRREDGLLQNVSAQWNLVDWPENLRDGYDFPLTRPIVGKGCHNVINALWYGSLAMRERMEQILELPSNRPAAPVAESFLRVFYRPKQKRFADSAQSSHCALHSNLYAAFFGLLPAEAEAEYEALLLTPGRVCGVFPMYFALRGLARLGKQETLFRLLSRTDDYGWRNMLRQGATACFEAWGKEQKWNTSLCHPWASAPISLMIEELAGFHPDPDSPCGYRFEPKFKNPPADFRLVLPFRGCQYEIYTHHNTLQLERMSLDVKTPNE